MQLRKLAASALGALITGATLAFPAAAATLADYPTPFVSDSEADFSVVVGSDAAAQDVASAIDIAVTLGGQPTTTETKAAAGAAGTWSVSGDGSTLDTSTTKLRFGDNMDSARSTLTSSQIPELLKSGTVQYGSTTRNYDQYISPAAKTTDVTTSGDLDNAKQLVKIGTTTGSGLYDAKVTFTQALNVTAAGNDNAEITLFGNTYQIDSSSDNQTLVMWGGRDTMTLRNDETGPASGTYTSGAGNEHTLEVVSVVDSDTAAFKIDDALKEKNEDATITVDNEEVKLEKIIVLNSNKNTGVVEFAIGSSKYKLEDGKRVEIGGDYVDNTQVTVTAGSTVNKISGVTINVAAQNSDNDYVAVGESFTDPVFGTFKFKYGGLNPSVDADSRDEIKVYTSGDEAKVSFTDWQGESGNVIFGHDPDTTNQGDTFEFNDDGSPANDIIIAEGQAADKNDYVIVDKGNYPHLLTVDSFSSLGLSDAEMSVSDVFSGDSYTVSLGDDNKGTLYLDGQKYYFNATSGTTNSVRITWGTGAGYAEEGDSKTIFPYLRGNNGEKVVVGPGYNQNAGYQINLRGVKDSTVENLTIPSGADQHGSITVSADSANNFTLSGDTTAGLNTTVSGETETVDVGSLTYNFTSGTGNMTNVSIQTSSSASPISDPFAMVIEEKSVSAKSGSSDMREAIAVDTTDDSSSYLVAQPSFTLSVSGSDGNIADGDESLWIDKYGTKIWRDSNNKDEVKIYYPDDQATVGVGFLASGASMSRSATGEVTCTDKIVPITSSVAKLDTDISEPSAVEENLILVGGPCVNTLVADLLSAGKLEGVNVNATTCDARWNDAPELQLVEDAFATDQTALVVAGATREGTANAAAALQDIGALPDAATKDV